MKFTIISEYKICRISPKKGSSDSSPVKKKNKILKGLTMIYTKLTKKALILSYDAHKDQVDKSGVPYIFHPFHLAEQMDDENSVCTALLHDVIEDTYISPEDLIREGFPKEVTDALKLLTHDEDIPYFEYVRNLRNNPLARKVKLADLKHNSDISRLDKTDEHTQRRLEKYRKAMEILS